MFLNDEVKVVRQEDGGVSLTLYPKSPTAGLFAFLRAAGAEDRVRLYRLQDGTPYVDYKRPFTCYHASAMLALLKRAVRHRKEVSVKAIWETGWKMAEKWASNSEVGPGKIQFNPPGILSWVTGSSRTEIRFDGATVVVSSGPTDWENFDEFSNPWRSWNNRCADACAAAEVDFPEITPEFRADWAARASVAAEAQGSHEEAQRALAILVALARSEAKAKKPLVPHGGGRAVWPLLTHYGLSLCTTQGYVLRCWELDKASWVFRANPGSYSKPESRQIPGLEGNSVKEVLEFLENF